MAQLGNVLQGGDGAGPRGPDLRVQVQVPPGALGHDGGVYVRIPLELPAGGRRGRRAPSPFDQRDRVLLRLPASLPNGAAIALRGQGAQQEGCQPGDLHVQVQVVQGQPDQTWAGYASGEPRALLAGNRLYWIVGIALFLLIAGLVVADLM